MLTDSPIPTLKRKYPAGLYLEVRNERRLVFEKVETAVVAAHVEKEAQRRTTKDRTCAEARVVGDGASAAAFDERLLDQEPVVDERKHTIGRRPAFTEEVLERHAVAELLGPLLARVQSISERETQIELRRNVKLVGCARAESMA